MSHHDDLVVTELPLPGRGPDGRYDLGTLSTGDGHPQVERILLAVARLLHKGAALRLPLVFRPSATNNSRDQFREAWLPVPFDLVWLDRVAAVPDVLWKGAGAPPLQLAAGGLRIFTDFTGHEARWIEAGWVEGQDYSGPVPPPQVSALKRWKRWQQRRGDT